MEINKLVDLNSLRTAPFLSSSQIKKLSEELETNIYNADWITIGIMAPCDTKAIEALKSISRKYTSIKFRDLDYLNADGSVFLKGNQMKNINRQQLQCCKKAHEKERRSLSIV